MNHDEILWIDLIFYGVMVFLALILWANSASFVLFCMSCFLAWCCVLFLEFLWLMIDGNRWWLG